MYATVLRKVRLCMLAHYPSVSNCEKGPVCLPPSLKQRAQKNVTTAPHKFSTCSQTYLFCCFRVWSSEF